jgi:hypothetical protein
MLSESAFEVKFDIGHVLFIDIVAYSKLLITQQTEQLALAVIAVFASTKRATLSGVAQEGQTRSLTRLRPERSYVH